MAEDGVGAMTLAESVHVEAPPEAVWALVTDVTRTGEWSPVCTACAWDDPAAGAVVGATFTGHNTSGGRSWQTTCTVTAADRPHEFRWEVNGGLVRWGYLLAGAAGGTELTETWEFTPRGRAFFAEKYGDAAPRMVAQRAEEARTGVPASLAAIKRLAEG